MELRYLRTFREVATLSSFSRAAETLHYAQSTVSAHIKLLEEELGLLLFDRLGRQISLTEAGELLFNKSQRLLSIEEETLAEITGHCEPKGSLTIRVPQTISTYLLPPVLVRFQGRMPKVRVEFIGCTFSVEHELRTGTIDLAFLIADSVTSRHLYVEYLGTEPLLLVSHADHRLQNRVPVDLNDLAGQTLLLSKTDCSYRKPFEKLLAEQKVEPAAILEFNTIEAIKQSVMAGLGITLMPRRAVAAEIEAGKLVVLESRELDLESAVLMIWHQDKWLSPALQAFIETVREILGSNPSGLGT
jgi:DNA-binding transcriptional LysR family regulator